MSLPCSMFGGREGSESEPNIACGGSWGQTLSEIPTHEGRMAELERRYDQFLEAEDQC